MITGDNPLTAAAIAAEAGVDDFLQKQSQKINSKGYGKSKPTVIWLG